MLIDNLDSIPNLFKDGVRGILLLYRNKDGEKGNAQRKALKKVSRNIEEWNLIINSFRELQLFSETYKNHRIYASVNSRNINKAIHQFKIRQLCVDYGNEFEKDWFYVDIQNRFFSCLMNPSSKNQNNFLIDCDTIAEYEYAKEKIPSELIIYDYQTKNGRHIITKPFNPNEINVPIKKDDLIFIG